MDLVGEGVGEEDHVHPVFGVGEALDPAVEEGLEPGLALGGVGGDKALGGGLGAVVLHQDSGTGGDLGEVAQAIAIEHVVPVLDIAGVDQGGGGIGDIAQAVHGPIQPGVFRPGHQVKGGGAGIAHIGETLLHGGLGLAAEGSGPGGGVSLGDVGGGGKAHEVHGGGVIVPLEAVAHLLGIDKAGIALPGCPGDKDGGRFGDDLGLHRPGGDAGGRDEIGILYREEVGIGADEVALSVPFGDHAHGLARFEQGVDGGGGILGGVGDDGILPGDAGEIRAHGLEILHGPVVVESAAAGGEDGLAGGGLGHGDHVKAPGLVKGGDALGIEHRPPVDEGPVIESAVGHAPLGLVHGDDHRPRGIGDAAIGELLFGDEDLHIVAGEPLHHVGGRLEIGLVGPIQGDDVAFGVEVAVLALALVFGAEDVHFGPFHVVLAAQPLAHLVKGVGIEVVDAPLEDLHLAAQVGELFFGHIGGLTQDAVLDGLGRVVAVGWELNGIGHGAMEHGELGGVAGGHIIPRVLPAGLGAVSGVAQIVPLGDHIAVVAGVVGHRGDAQGLAAADEMLRQEIVFKVGLVRGIAGLALEGLHPPVELREGEGVVGADELLHIGGLAGGLEGVVPVEVIAARGMPGEIGPAVHVFLGDQDEEDVLQQFVLHIHCVALHGVIFFQIQLAGDALVLAGEAAQVAGLVLHQIGDGHAALLALGAHLSFQLGLALGGEAGEHIIGDGLFADDHLGEIQDTVGGRGLVGVDVGVHHRDADVIELAALEVLEHLVGVALGLLGELEPAVHAGFAVGDDEIGHIPPGGGEAHGELFHIKPVFRPGLDHLVQLGVDLPHGIEALIGGDLHGGGTGLFAADGGTQVKIAAQVDEIAAVHMGDAVVQHRVALLPAVVIVPGGGIEIVVHVEGDVEHRLAVLLPGGELDIRELVLILPLGHPAVQGTAGKGVGVEGLVHIGAAAVPVQREGHLTGRDGGLQLALAHTGEGDGHGHIGPAGRRGQGDDGVHGKLGPQQGIVLGVHVLDAHRRRPGGQQGQRQRQGQQQGQDLAALAGMCVFHGSSSLYREKGPGFLSGSQYISIFIRCQ